MLQLYGEVDEGTSLYFLFAFLIAVRIWQLVRLSFFDQTTQIYEMEKNTKIYLVVLTLILIIGLVVGLTLGLTEKDGSHWHETTTVQDSPLPGNWLNKLKTKKSFRKQSKKTIGMRDAHPYEKNTSNYAYIDQISHKNRPEFNI